jgi:hypothetical protein
MNATLRVARRAVFGFFGIDRASLAVWVAYIPTAGPWLGLDSAPLGRALLAVARERFDIDAVRRGLGGRFGSAVLTCAAGIVLPFTLIGLVACLLLPGAAKGPTDVSMNARAVEVSRPIVSAFHAVLSLGGALGAGLCSLLPWASSERSRRLPQDRALQGYRGR